MEKKEWLDFIKIAPIEYDCYYGENGLRNHAEIWLRARRPDKFKDIELDHMAGWNIKDVIVTLTEEGVHFSYKETPDSAHRNTPCDYVIEYEMIHFQDEEVPGYCCGKGVIHEVVTLSNIWNAMVEETIKPEWRIERLKNLIDADNINANRLKFHKAETLTEVWQNHNDDDSLPRDFNERLGESCNELLEVFNNVGDPNFKISDTKQSKRLGVK